jgi:hypothetical protein
MSDYQSVDATDITTQKPEPLITLNDVKRCPQLKSRQNIDSSILLDLQDQLFDRASISLRLDPQSKSTTKAIAKLISFIISGGKIPSLRTNRCKSTPRNCRTSTAEVFVNPLSTSASTQTCQGLSSKCCFQSVRGAISLSGNFPIESTLITTTGRVLRISDPIVGFKLTNQISDLSGKTSILNEVTA